MTATVLQLRKPEPPALVAVDGPPTFTAAEACPLAGVTYRQLDFWTRADLLHPVDGEASPGSGHPRRYGETEVKVARMVRRLLEVGFTLRAAFEHGRASVEGRAAVCLADGLVVIAADGGEQ